jgi:2-oxoglutarate ferredoxin oxidoreductase subunit beta
MPTPVGVFYATSRPTYDGAVNAQLAEAKKTQGPGELRSLLRGGDTWKVN